MTQPTCATGPISTSYDVHGLGTNTCSLAANPPQLGNSPAGQCDTDLFKGNSDGLDFEYVPPPASGGVCTGSGQATGSVSYGGNDRACAPDTAQTAACACAPSLPSPYQTCIAQSGSVACPPGTPYSTQHVVGTSGDVTCSACDCTTTASCSGVVALYTDSSCTQGETNIAADGACHPGPAASLIATDFNSYKYIPNSPVNVACTPSGPSTASVALANEETVCRAQ